MIGIILGGEMKFYENSPYEKSRHNRGAYKLCKQRYTQIFEWIEYGVKPDKKLISTSVMEEMFFGKLLYRSNNRNRSWKKYRKTQYKLK